MTTPYPPQQYLPPPPRRKVWPWVVFPLIVVLVAAGVTAVLAATDDDGTSGLPVQKSGCTGGYCVGRYPYANACEAFGIDGLWQLFPGSDNQLRVHEILADPLPASATNVESSCELAPLDDKSAVQWILLHLRETSTTEAAAVEPGSGTSGPLAGVPGAVVFDQDEQTEAHWVHGNTSVKLTMATKRGKPLVARDDLVKLVRQVDTALATPKGPARPLPGGTRGDAKVYTDACAVFVGNDLQQATGYVVNPGYIEREYSYPGDYDEDLGSACHRYTAKADTGYPKPPGTTYLDGLMDPQVTVFPTPDKATAMQKLADDKVRLTDVVAVPGVGDAAVFGGSGTLEFVKDFHVVRIGCTPDGDIDMRAKLTSVAKAVSARMR